MALERHPDLAKKMVDLGHEIVSHGWRWLHYQEIDIETEREHMRIATQKINRNYWSCSFGLVYR
jgi:peptidoglycan/xylan/chitin deacetylase (PgdA/CDA1 family)